MKFVLQNPLSRKGIVKVSKHWLRKKIVERRLLGAEEARSGKMQPIQGIWWHPGEPSGSLR